MPPTRHSNSSAHKDSDQIPSDQNYTLGDYSFRIERTSVPGSTNDKIEAICTKDGKNARKSIQLPSTTNIDSWSVEANETEASVYIKVSSLIRGDIKSANVPAAKQFDHNYKIAEASNDYSLFLNPNVSGLATVMNHSAFVFASQEDGSCRCFFRENNSGIGYVSSELLSEFTLNNKTVYYCSFLQNYLANIIQYGVIPESIVTPNSINLLAWSMIYGADDENGAMLVARFAIDLEDAGGVGPESDWIDPGDYDEDWEEGDPTQTLYVTVTGALSGRHNDPIVDPSYSYIPADKDTVKGYGCGGDGGHGGGGGAGASTVVIHKFVTNQADSKEVTAIARRHGYGSGGGKGGKGGDGCILIYY